MTDRSTTRRGFLAATAAALVAGCDGLKSGSDGQVSISSARLTEGIENSDPIVVESLPVDIESARLRDVEDRVGALLDRLPLPLTESEVPNGYIRRELTDAARDATTAVEDARTAGSRYQALLELQIARTQARFAAAGWGAIDGDTTIAELRNIHERTVSDAGALRSRHDYLGTDPIDALLAHAVIERELHTVLDGTGPSLHGTEGSVLAVAEWGEQTERAQASLMDGQYLYDRFTGSLPADASSVEERLTSAQENLIEELRNRRADLSPESNDDEQGHVGQLLHRIRSDADRSVDRVAELDRPATAIVTATEGLSNVRAYDTLKNRIEEDPRIEIEEASEVRDARMEALEAIQTALEESPEPDLARSVLADLAANVAFADERLARYRGDIDASQLEDPVSEYLSATVRAKGVPEAVQVVQGSLSI